MPELNLVSTDVQDPPGAAGLVQQHGTSLPGYYYDGANDPSGNGFLEFGSGTPGSLPFRVDHNGNVTALSFSAPSGDGVYVQQSETKEFVSVGNSTVVYRLQPTGTGDAQGLGQFGDVFQDRTYGTSPAVNEIVWMSGYNCPAVSGVPIMCTTIHPDAGDTNFAGAHGVEWLLQFSSPSLTHTINAIEFVAPADESGSGNLTFRCGTGTESGFSQIIFGNNATSFLQLTSSAVTVETPTLYLEPASGAPQLVLIAPAGSAAGISLRAAASQPARIYFQVGATLEWELQSSGTTFRLTDVADSGRAHATFTQGSTSLLALTEFASQLRVDSSLIVGKAVLATTATDGFLYIPSCAGAPAGAPTTQAGTVALVYDTTENKLWAYNEGWQGVAV